MPSQDVRSQRNRKRTRSRRHFSPNSTSPSNDPSSSTELQPQTTTTGPSNSSSDEKHGHNKSPTSSIGSNSMLDDEQWKRTVRRLESDGLKDTVWWGYFLLGITWIVFVLGIGGVCGIWEWSIKPIRTVQERRVIEGDEVLEMSGYYSSLMVLTGAVVAWIWVVFNWVGMKYFRHN